MLIVAITGGIGSGKSTVVDRFREKGVPIIDTDVIAREVVQDSATLQQLVTTFGQDILNTDGTLNRSKLRTIAFDDTENRTRLNDLLHPLIFQQTVARLSKLTAPYCLLVIPLLYESRFPYPYDRVLVIDVDIEQQLQRAMQRDAASEANIRNIIAAQATREQRLSIADDVIDNSADFSQLALQVDALHKKYLRLAEDNISG